jgi:hypothetical protein
MTIKLTPRKTVLASFAAVASFSTIALPVFAVESPWLPSPGSNSLTFSFSNQSADELRAGNSPGQLPTSLKQDTYKLNYSFGIADALALDVETGYAKSKFITVPGLAPNGGQKGVTDSRLGLRFRVLDDLADAPLTVTLGAAAILKGDYDTGALPAIGDGANALEISASVGKAITSNFNIYGTVGYRDRKAPVPNENFYQLGLAFNPTSQLGFSLTHEEIRSKGNLDIGGPGFSPARFPEVKEDYGFTSVGASFRFTRNLGIGVQYGEKQAKRNTAESKVYGLSLNTSF